MAKQPTDWKVWWEDLFGILGCYAFDGWVVMLLFGILHSQSHGVPALGYWYSLFASFVVAGLVGTGSRSVYQRVKILTPNYGKKQQRTDRERLDEILAKLK